MLAETGAFRKDDASAPDLASVDADGWSFILRVLSADVKQGAAEAHLLGLLISGDLLPFSIPAVPLLGVL